MQGGMGLVVAKFSTFQVHTIPFTKCANMLVYEFNLNVYRDITKCLFVKDKNKCSFC